MKEEGSKTKVELIPFKSSADVFIAMRSGEIDMASMGMNVLASGLAENPDLPVSMVAGVSPGRSQLLLRKDSGIRTWQDIRGRNIGIVRGSTDELIFKIALAKSGIDMAKDTKVTTFQAPADLLLALRNGDVDAVVTYQPNTAQAVSQGIATEPADLNKDLIEWASVPTDVIATDKVIESNPDGVQDVIDTYVDITRTFDDKGVWVDTALKYQSGDKPLLLGALSSASPWWQIQQDTHKTMASAMAEYGTVSTDVGDALIASINYDFLAKATGQTAEELGKTGDNK
jgi:NitT/TauT family transport system substrate-binding protein